MNDQRSATDPVERRLLRYWDAYLNAVRDQRGHHESVAHALPDWLTEPLRIAVYRCSDGIIALHYTDVANAFEYGVTEKTVRDIARETSGEGSYLSQSHIEVDLDLGSPPADIEIADVQVLGPPTTDGTERKVLRTKWDRATVSSRIDANRWSVDLAAAKARADVLAAVAEALMQTGSAKAEDVADRLEALADEFEEFLAGGPREEDVQQFLTANPVLLDPEAGSVLPKVALGSEFVTDFVIERADAEFVLVELEPPTMPLYTKGGDPSARLNHAEKQVEDWREWISENIAYARQKLPGIQAPSGIVIMGRARAMTRKNQKALRRRNRDRSAVTVWTYDDMLERLRRFIANLRV